MNNNIEHISPKINGPSQEGTVRVKVFAINNKGDRAEYESILNDEDVRILNESNPTFDKMGRAFIILKWLELDQ